MRDDLIPIDGFALRRHRKAKGWVQKQLARAAKVSLRQISLMERGKAVDFELSIRPVADALGIDPSEITTNSARDTSTPLGETGDSAPLPIMANELRATLVTMTDVVALIERLSRDDFKAIKIILRQILSSCGRAEPTDVERGSVVIRCIADDSAMYDMLESFLAWRLQHIGIYGIRVATRDHAPNVAISLASHFHFPNDSTRNRFLSHLSSGRLTTIATDTGLHLLQTHPVDVPEVQYIPACVRACAEVAADAIYSAAEATGDATLLRLASVMDQVAEGTFRGKDTGVARINEAIIKASARVYNVEGHRHSWVTLYGSYCSNMQMLRAPWHTVSVSSTLGEQHLRDSGAYWERLELENVPERARFRDEVIMPQRAILMDDEMFQIHERSDS